MALGVWLYDTGPRWPAYPSLCWRLSSETAPSNKSAPAALRCATVATNPLQQTASYPVKPSLKPDSVCVEFLG